MRTFNTRLDIKIEDLGPFTLPDHFDDIYSAKLTWESQDLYPTLIIENYSPYFTDREIQRRYLHKCLAYLLELASTESHIETPQHTIPYHTHIPQYVNQILSLNKDWHVYYPHNLNDLLREIWELSSLLGGGWDMEP